MEKEYPEVYSLKVADTQNNLGALYWKVGRFEEANNAYKEAIVIREQVVDKNLENNLPNVAMTQNNLGALYYDLGKYEEAENAYKKALQIRKKLATKSPEPYLPKVADTQNNLAILYMDMGNLEEAEKCIIEVLKINPNYKPAWYNRACIESLRNNQEKSIKFLKKALDLDKKYCNMAKTDEDLDNIRDSREFKELINKSLPI